MGTSAAGKVTVTTSDDPRVYRETTAMELVTEHRAAILELDPSGLSKDEAVVAFGVATKLKNLVERRVSALRKRVDALFLEALDGVGMTTKHIFHLLAVEVFPGGGAGSSVAAKLLNGTYGKKVLSEDLAFALLATKKPSAKRMCMEKPLRPPQPPPRFSAQKFRELVATGIITQAEHDACMVEMSPTATMTVEIPPEVEKAILASTLRAPPGV